MNIGYYPGCSLFGTGKEFDKSLKEVLKVLDVTLDEVKDWSCCGASSAHVTSHFLSVALPARNLILAKEQNLDNVVAPCAACYNRLLGAQLEMNSNPILKEKVEHAIEKKFTNHLTILNLVDLFNKVGLENVKAKVTKSLKGINVACYYGCLLVRPNNLTKFDDAEQPEEMEKIISALGGTPVEWNYKVECCGAAHSIAHVEIVKNLSKKILDDAIKNKADVIVVACPMCHSNLDMRQKNIANENKDFKEIPVLYLTELMGLAFGIDEKKLGLDLHFIDAMKFSKRLEEAAV